jgi:hypothetical protein
MAFFKILAAGLLTLGCASPGRDVPASNDGGEAHRASDAGRSPPPHDGDLADIDSPGRTCTDGGTTSHGFPRGPCGSLCNPWLCAASTEGNWCAPFDESMGNCSGSLSTGVKCSFVVPPYSCVPGFAYICCPIDVDAASFVETGDAAAPCACSDVAVSGQWCRTWHGVDGDW